MGERTVHDRRWWILGTLVLSLLVVIAWYMIFMRELPVLRE